MTRNAPQDNGYAQARKELARRIETLNRQIDANDQRIEDAKRELESAEDFRVFNTALRDGYMQILKLTPDPRPSVES